MKKLAVIGCGLRSDCYLHELRSELGREWQIIGLADPNSIAIEVYRKNFCCADAIAFQSGPELFTAIGDKLDGVIIASPNALHLESFLPSLDKRLVILLEKPVATTIEHCAMMWQAYLDSDKPPVAVGFVLRYTNFYRKIKELIKNGCIGQLLSIDADEMMDAPLTANFMRGWRREMSLSGPMLVEKCSHDMDILNSLAEARMSKVSSFGRRTRFVNKPEAAMYCKECNLKNTCRYAAGAIAPYLMNVSRRAELEKLIPADNDLCVFNSHKDIWDHQIVGIEYENGVLACFKVCMDQPRTTRTIKINGTEGQIYGDIGQNFFELRIHPKGKLAEESVERIEIVHDNSGHHGGDSIISNQFKAMLRGEPTPPLAGLREGIEAVLVALAAEKSVVEKRVIEGKELYGRLSDF